MTKINKIKTFTQTGKIKNTYGVVTGKKLREFKTRRDAEEYLQKNKCLDTKEGSADD